MANDIVPLRELTSVLWTEGRGRRLALCMIFAAIALSALVAGVLWPKKYVASTTILVQESDIIKPLLEGRASTTGVADRAGIARQVIFSRKSMDDILKTGGWMDEHPTPLEQDRIIDQIQGRTTVTAPRVNLLQITYSDSDPTRTFVVTKRMAALFIDESLKSKERESRDAFEFIDSQVEAYRDKLTTAENKLKLYREANVDARPGSETDTNTRISQLRTQVETARMDVMEARSKETALAAQLSGQSEVTAVQTREGIYQAQLAQLQAQLDKLLLTYTDNYPDVIRVRHQIADLKEQLQQATEQKQNAKLAGTPTALDQNVQFNPLYQELKSKQAEIHSTIAAAQSRMSASESLLQQELDRSKRIANSENALSELTRDYDVNRDIYQDLLKRRENARVSMNLDQARRGLTFRIQDPAMMPLRPSGLRFLHFGLAGLFLAIAMPLGLLFALARFDPRVRSAAQLERISGLPVLATIPVYQTRRDRVRERARTSLAALIIIAVMTAYVIVSWLKLKRML
ncbi:MAG: XrtA system polysaccharide chain length determinant [Rhodanobacteraceae bacterium]